MIIHTISTATDIPISTSIEDMRSATNGKMELQMLKNYIFRGLLHPKDDVEPDVERYWPIKNELTMIDGIAMKGKQIIIHYILQKQIQEQLHSNHIDIKKAQFLSESVYWINIVLG